MLTIEEVEFLFKLYQKYGYEELYNMIDKMFHENEEGIDDVQRSKEGNEGV